jgi:F0F1-type ATP synthase beta subunit
MNTPSFTHLQALRELQQCESAETLTPAVHSLCSHFGTVENLVVLTARHAGAKQAICFLRLASEAQEQALIQALGATKLGIEVVIVVDLKANAQKVEPPNSYINFNWQSVSVNANQQMAQYAS